MTAPLPRTPVRRRRWWITDWLGRTPARGSDELFRHTLVLPWPFGGQDVGDEDGDLAYRALVVVTRPWWLCRDALDPAFRAMVRWQRALEASTDDLDTDDDQAWDDAYAAHVAAHGPIPDPMSRRRH